VDLAHVNERLRALLRGHGAEDAHGLPHSRPAAAFEHASVGLGQFELVGVTRRDGDRHILGRDRAFADLEGLRPRKNVEHSRGRQQDRERPAEHFRRHRRAESQDVLCVGEHQRCGSASVQRHVQQDT
jgi:hypothetical protein